VLKVSGSVGLAIFPIGIAFGMLVAHSGLAWWWATVFSCVIFAGSFEFLLIGLTVAAAPLAQIALTALLVNSRHLFYALSFPLHRVESKAGKTYSTFALTDEAYALTASDTARSWPSRRILWLQASIHAYWVAGATTGAALGAVIPAHIAGLNFAMTALFTVLAIDAFRARRDVPILVLAVACALIARFLLPGQLLLAAFALFTAVLLARHACPGKANSHASHALSAHRGRRLGRRHLGPAGPALHRPGPAARQRRRGLPQRPHAARGHGDPARLHPEEPATDRPCPGAA
jgi:4-azaleucine resistance transporter AzlC